MKFFTLAAIAGLAAGIRHFLAHRAASHAPHRRPVIGLLAGRVRDAAGLPANVSITSHKGIVTLKGGPMPRAEIDRALLAVLAVPGVHQVRNYVQTEGGAPEALA